MGFRRSGVRAAALLAAATILSGCATWSVSSVDAPQTTPSSAPAAQARAPSRIIVTENDITDRAYESLGDISVTVNKTTLFHPDPTPRHVDERLREEAAELGADAVILVRYGTVGIGVFSWGTLDGKGRAVRFVQ